MRKAQWRPLFDRSAQPVHSDRADKAMKMTAPSAHLVLAFAASIYLREHSRGMPSRHVNMEGAPALVNEVRREAPVNKGSSGPALEVA